MEFIDIIDPEEIVGTRPGFQWDAAQRQEFIRDLQAEVDKLMNRPRFKAIVDAPVEDALLLFAPWNQKKFLRRFQWPSRALPQHFLELWEQMPRFIGESTDAHRDFHSLIGNMKVFIAQRPDNGSCCLSVPYGSGPEEVEEEKSVFFYTRSLKTDNEDDSLELYEAFCEGSTKGCQCVVLTLDVALAAEFSDRQTLIRRLGMKIMDEAIQKAMSQEAVGKSISFFDGKQFWGDQVFFLEEEEVNNSFAVVCHKTVSQILHPTEKMEPDAVLTLMWMYRALVLRMAELHYEEYGFYPEYPGVSETRPHLPPELPEGLKNVRAESLRWGKLIFVMNQMFSW